MPFSDPILVGPHVDFTDKEYDVTALLLADMTVACNNSRRTQQKSSPVYSPFMETDAPSNSYAGT
jgi:hypothetical protein